MRKWYVLSVQIYSSAKLKNRQTFVRGGWGGGRGSKFVPDPHQTNVCKIWRHWGAISSLVFNNPTCRLGNFSNLKAFFPLVSLACPCQKLKTCNSELKEVSFWVAPPRYKEISFWAAPPCIDYYRDPPLSHGYGSFKINTLTLDTLKLA